jgi:hypothetical protein
MKQTDCSIVAFIWLQVLEILAFHFQKKFSVLLNFRNIPGYFLQMPAKSAQRSDLQTLSPEPGLSAF